MSMSVTARARMRAVRLTGFIITSLAIAVVIWIDVATGLWQQAVVLSGIAAGLLTFLLTSVCIERWMSAAAHRRWYPVTRLALTDLLHGLADEERSHLARGRVLPRRIDESDDHETLLHSIHTQRRTITHALARWTGFLAASADVQPLMDRIAELALLLDAAQDAVLSAEQQQTEASTQERMRAAVAAVDTAIAATTVEIERTLERLASAN